MQKNREGAPGKKTGCNKSGIHKINAIITKTAQRDNPHFVCFFMRTRQGFPYFERNARQRAGIVRKRNIRKKNGLRQKEVVFDPHKKTYKIP